MNSQNEFLISSSVPRSIFKKFISVVLAVRNKRVDERYRFYPFQGRGQRNQYRKVRTLLCVLGQSGCSSWKSDRIFQWESEFRQFFFSFFLISLGVWCRHNINKFVIIPIIKINSLILPMDQFTQCLLFRFRQIICWISYL